MKKAQITALAQALIAFISDSPRERNNMVDWADGYVQDIEIYTGEVHDCQYCELRPAAVVLEGQNPEGTPDKVCKHCLIGNMYDFLEAIRDVKRP